MNIQAFISTAVGDTMNEKNGIKVAVTPQEKWPEHVKLAFIITAIPVATFVGLSIFAAWVFASMISVGNTIASDDGTGMAVAATGFMVFVILGISIVALGLIITLLVSAYTTKKRIFSIISIALGSIATVILGAILISWLID